jgi:hypothetical protein
VVLEAVRALVAVRLQAAAGLGTDADAVADLDVFDVASDLDGLADNLVTYAAGFTLSS